MSLCVAKWIEEVEETMYFAIDIDETIANGSIQGDLATNIAYYEQLGITFPMPVPDFPSLLHDPAVIPLHRPIAGAREGLNVLARRGRIGYYTVRKHHDPERAALIQQVTRQWLQQHAFPAGENVTFCQSVVDKLDKLYQHERTSQELLVLIDDRWSTILQHFDRAFAGEYEVIGRMIKQRLLLVAYGADHVPTDTHGFRLAPLPSWAEVEHINFDFDMVQEEEAL